MRGPFVSSLLADAPPPDVASSPSATSVPIVPRHQIADGPFEPTWNSLAENYHCPDWFRDAKFGIWAHWSAQCVPEQGDWYARRMYEPEDEPWAKVKPGLNPYEYHVKTYGHPSKVGYMEILNHWHAEHWNPDELIDLYKRAGAKYFVALANHHDNFDTYDSKYQPWNSLNVGPHRDLIGDWAKAARAHGLRFGVSNHSSHAWHWFQVAYGYDGDGPYAGIRYDAFTLRKEDGIGKWWQGLDPQDLYTGPQIVMPDGLKSQQAVSDWRKKFNHWQGDVIPNNPKFIDKWFLRAQDLIDKYHPDCIFLDNSGLPFGQAGLDLAAHYYNASIRWNGGKLDVVATTNSMDKLPSRLRTALVTNFERSGSNEIRGMPWQTGTCIGSWHYDRSIFEQHRYKTVTEILHMLADTVSKNGNLLLSVPLRGDGTIDEDEHKFLDGMAAWMDNNGECIFGTRPWRVYGEGPSVVAAARLKTIRARSDETVPYTSEDFRFTSKGDALYAIGMEWPKDRTVLITSLALGSLNPSEFYVRSVNLLGYGQQLVWQQSVDGLQVQLPSNARPENIFALKIDRVAAR